MGDLVEALNKNIHHYQFKKVEMRAVVDRVDNLTGEVLTSEKEGIGYHYVIKKKAQSDSVMEALRPSLGLVPVTSAMEVIENKPELSFKEQDIEQIEAVMFGINGVEALAQVSSEELNNPAEVSLPQETAGNGHIQPDNLINIAPGFLDK